MMTIVAHPSQTRGQLTLTAIGRHRVMYRTAKTALGPCCQSDIDAREARFMALADLSLLIYAVSRLTRKVRYRYPHEGILHLRAIYSSTIHIHDHLTPM